MTVLTNCQESPGEKLVSSREVILNMVLNSSTSGSNGSAVSYGIRPPDSMMTASLLHHFPVPSVGPPLVSSRTMIDQTTNNSGHHHHPSRTAFGIQQLLGLGSAGGGGDDSSPGSRSSSASSSHHRPTPPNVGHGNCHESIGNIPTSSSLVLPSSASSPLSSSSVFSRSPGSSSHYHQQHQSHSFPPTSSSSSSVPSFLPSTMSSYLNSTTAAFMSAAGHSGSHHPLSMSMFANSFPGSHVDNFSRSDVCGGKTFTGLYFVEIYLYRTSFFEVVL